MKFFMSMFILIGIVCCGTVSAGFEGLQEGTSLGIYNRIDCTDGMTCSKTKDKFTITSLAVFDYDFATDGGVVSTIASGVTLPAKTVIEKCWFRVQTQIVDAGSGTLAVQCEDANNILSAADQSGLADGTFLASSVSGTVSSMVDDIAAECDISWVIGGAAITAGKVRGYCRYSLHE